MARIAFVLGVIERPARFPTERQRSGAHTGQSANTAKLTLLTPSGHMLNQNSVAQRAQLLIPFVGTNGTGESSDACGVERWAQNSLARA
jgi:hypothetical protein